MPQRPAAAPYVRADVWHVPTGRIPQAMAVMARSRSMLRHSAALFSKALGTGHGASFTAKDADLHHWMLLTTWSSAQAQQAADQAAPWTAWHRMADRHVRLDLRPVASTGTWSGCTPFATDENASAGEDIAGPVAVITRAQVKLRQWRTFQRSVPPVADQLHDCPGLQWAIGMGEAPVGLQGTFSVWQDRQSLTHFAYRTPEHVAVMKKTAATGWYSEELFARFTVTASAGEYHGTRWCWP